MELLVTMSTRKGIFTSPLWARRGAEIGYQNFEILVRMPETVQELRESCDNCGMQLPIAKFLDSIRLRGSGVGPEMFDRLMSDFCRGINDANTRGTICQVEDECIELTAVFTNNSIFKYGKYGDIDCYDLPGLINLTKDLTLSEAWQD